MLFGLVVSLFTSRILLQALGVVDYGLNNVVGGVVTLFAIITACLNTATARFLTIELGKGNIVGMREIYSNTNTLYLFVGIITFLLEETIGLFIVNKVLVIPPTRLFACNVLYQTIVITSMLSLLKVPSGALIISYEKMDVYAYIGVADIILKCLIVYVVMITTYDKLIVYSIIHLLVVSLIIFYQLFYCKKQFANVYNLTLRYNKSLLRSMVGFSFWNIIGSAAFILRIQGVNVLLNIFFGPIVNAANAIAYQVNSAINGFVSNFTTAVNPQIIKSYSAQEFETMKNLIYRAGKFSYFLLLLLCMPILFETNYVLHLWLGDRVPDYTVIMTRLVLLIAMVESFTYSIGCAVNANGNIRNYQLVICGIMLTIFPMAWFMFKIGMPPYFGLIDYLITSIVALIARFYFMKHLLGIQPFDYINKVYYKVILVTLISIAIPFLYLFLTEESIFRFLTMVILVEICTILSIWLLGLDSKEKSLVYNYVRKLIHK